ncbi:MAG: HPr(Ser) kinase/phosphatase [candidate division WOR-3 bacterium]
METRFIEVSKLYEGFLKKFCKVLAGERGFWRRIKTPDISRPGLLLAGFEEEFPAERVQIIGLTERAYLLSLGERGEDAIKRLYSKEPPTVILTSFAEKINERLKNLFSYYAEKFSIPTFFTEVGTTRVISLIMDKLQYELAPTIYEHGVMVDVFGVGILLKGKSAIGKSECAIELIRRGHRFIADDLVAIKLYPADNLLAESPREEIKYYMEIKGVGIIHIPSIYGLQAVKEKTSLDCVIEFIPQEEFKYSPDTEVESVNYFGISVPKFKLPITPGKNMASIVETVALVYKKGDLAYQEFKEKLRKLVDKG